MQEPIFIETIKVLDGQFQNLDLHLDRIEKTTIHFFKQSIRQLIKQDLLNTAIPDEMLFGLVKCRLTYSYSCISIEFERYHYRKIKSLQLVEDDNVEYLFKYKDRNYLNKLLYKKGTSDDILIVKNGYITDTSYTNVVFEDRSGLYTPSTFLLQGIKRQLLIKQGVIVEREIKLSSIHKYTKLYLINTMIGIEDNICIEIQNVKK